MYTSNSESEGHSFHPWPWLDSLYDYAALISQPHGLAVLPPEQLGTEVAVVGAGAAGLVAAYELMKCGLKPVIFESTERIGGRLWSRPFTEADGSPSPVFAELGAMRFPRSGKAFNTYCDTLGLNLSTDFPNPGSVDTVLSYYGENLYWTAGTEVPGPFRSISKTWKEYLDILLSPLYEPWKRGDIERLRDVWQRYVYRFRRMNFGEVLHDVLPWTDEELSRFGALGIGTGGFDVFFPLAFTEFLRLLANGCEGHQSLVAEGCEEFARRLFAHQVTTPHGVFSLQNLCELNLLTSVTSIEYSREANEVIISTDKSSSPRAFSAAVVAVPLGRLQRLGLVGSDILSVHEREALQNLHTINSSKLFFRTKEKFWKKNGEKVKIPQVILTEQAPRATYFLDYEHTDHGVVVLSYTWEDDSQKWASCSAEEQYTMFRTSLVRIIPELEHYLVPLNNELIKVVWQAEPWAMGAFKLNFPGHDELTRRLFFQYHSVLREETDKGVYVAGDSISWSGGWIEGAIQTALNACCSVLRRLGGTLPTSSPLEINPHHIKY